jgi:hypothetical protein
VQSGNSAPMFQDNLSVPKKEQSLREDEQHNLLFWGPCPLSNFLNAHRVLEAGSVPIIKQRSTYPGGPLRLMYSQSLGTTDNNLLRYVPENSPSPMVATGNGYSKIIN